jgi:hypothetical protein
MEKKPIFIEATYDPENDVLTIKDTRFFVTRDKTISKQLSEAVSLQIEEQGKSIYMVEIKGFLEQSDAWKATYHINLIIFQDEFIHEIEKAKAGFRYVLTLMARRINVLENEINHY